MWETENQVHNNYKILWEDDLLNFFHRIYSLDKKLKGLNQLQDLLTLIVQLRRFLFYTSNTNLRSKEFGYSTMLAMSILGSSMMSLLLVL